MGRIATRAFCNTLKAGAFSSELTRCLTRNEIEAIGLTVTRTYAANQLVMEEDIKNLVNIITVGAKGNIIKTQVQFKTRSAFMKMQLAYLKISHPSSCGI